LEERLSSDVLAQMYHRLQKLEEEVKRLRGEVERLREVEARLRSSPVVPAPAATSPGSEEIRLPTEPQAQPAVEDPVAEAEEYRRAYALLEAGRYEEAVLAFHDFLRRFPMGAYAPNAYYWLGEAFYAQRKFDQAKEAFRTVLERFPESHKAGDAKLKLGFVAYEEGDYERAREILTEVARQYAGTRLARLALRRLDEMREKGLIR